MPPLSTPSTCHIPVYLRLCIYALQRSLGTTNCQQHIAVVRCAIPEAQVNRQNSMCNIGDETNRFKDYIVTFRRSREALPQVADPTAREAASKQASDKRMLNTNTNLQPKIDTLIGKLRFSI